MELVKQLLRCCRQDFGLASVCMPPAAFAQVNFGAMDRAVHAILHHIPPGSAVVDLHAGVGTIGEQLCLCFLAVLHWLSAQYHTLFKAIEAVDGRHCAKPVLCHTQTSSLHHPAAVWSELMAYWCRPEHHSVPAGSLCAVRRDQPSSRGSFQCLTGKALLLPQHAGCQLEASQR